MLHRFRIRSTSEPERLPLILRDELAVERTHLANQRTFLAFFRTGLALIVTAMAILEFKKDDYYYHIAAIALLVLGAITMIGGTISYFVSKRRIINRSYTIKQPDTPE